MGETRVKVRKALIRAQIKSLDKNSFQDQNNQVCFSNEKKSDYTPGLRNQRKRMIRITMIKNLYYFSELNIDTSQLNKDIEFVFSFKRYFICLCAFLHMITILIA